MTLDKRNTLRQFTVDELKEELAYRRTLDRAKKHLPSAEAALQRAQAKVEAYRKALAEETSVRARKVIAGKRAPYTASIEYHCDHEWQRNAGGQWCNKCGHGL